MGERARVVVVGAGVLGASTTYHLAPSLGRDLVLIDARGVAGGPSGSSSAIIRQNYSNAETARLARESLDFFRHFSELTGGECAYRATGCLSLVGPEEVESLERNLTLQRSVGIDVRRVSFDEIRSLEPELALDGIAAATYEPDAGHADPALTTSGMVSRARDLGARTILHTAVRSVEVVSGRVSGLLTDVGRIDVETVVLACGPWTPRLLTPLGIDLPIRVSRHAVCVYERPASFPRAHAVIGDFPNGVYIRSEGEGLTLVGSLDEGPEVEADPDLFPSIVTLDESAELGELLARRYPLMRAGRSRGGWSSVYDVTPDWHPIVDELSEIRGLYVAAGTSGHGFKLSPALGRIVAGLVTGEGGASEAAFFRRSRFATGELVTGRYAHRIVG